MRRHNGNNTLEDLSRREFFKYAVAGALAVTVPYSSDAEGEKYSFKPEVKSSDYYGIGFNHIPERKFNTLSYIDFEKALQATPEYRQMEKEKVTKGYGKYEILNAQASERINREVDKYMQENKVEIVLIGKDKLDLINGVTKEDRENPNLNITEKIIEAYKDKEYREYQG